ncbi:MAG: hypothetical protein ACRDOL_20865 [Streptosporangiaceae bacterium]
MRKVTVREAELLTRLLLSGKERRVQQLDGCCSKDAVDADGYGQHRGFRVDASGVAFELFVTL